MKLRVDDISADTRELSFLEPEQEINRVLGQGTPAEYHLPAAIAVKVSHYRAGTEVFLEGEVSARAGAACARCAEDFATVKSRRFRYVLAPRVVGDDKHPDLRAEDLEFSFYDGEEIDLTPLVREQMLLALGDRPICREDCKGLCPRCGANLNEGACGCRSEAPDPRFAVLRSLKVGSR